ARFAHPFADDFVQAAESPADHEENMLGVDGGGLRLFATIRQVHHSLKLAGNVIRSARRHFCFFHQLEEVCLDAAPAHIPATDIGGGGDFVDFVDVNDAVLSA